MANMKFWNREIPVSENVSEIFFTASSSSPEAADFEAAKREFLALASEGAEWVSVTVFRPASDTLSDSLVDVFKTFAPTAVVWGRGESGFSFSANGYRFSSTEAKETAFERFKTKEGASGHVLRTPESTVTALCAVTSDKKGFSKQVESFYESVSETVRSKKLKSADFVRSWNFIDSILKRYPEFNAVRDAKFEKLGVTAETCPAGTGIDFRTNGDALMVSFAEFRSAGSKSVPKIVRYKTPSQCEASSYGPKFSRAAYVEEGAWRRVHVSGTASVSPDGKTLNAEDISANVAHTMETVRELLDLAGADFSHVVRSYAYLKKPEYSSAFEDWKNRSGVDFPVASNVCDVCRDDWLFEFECVALVPVKKGVFKVFWNEADAIGNKAENCRILAEKGFPVPASLALTGEAARKIMLSESEKDRFYQTLADAFGPESVSKRYAVRSSSCFEDAVSDSKAGAFRSVLDVPFDEVSGAADTVRKSLERIESESLVPKTGKKAKLPPADFWVLVQEYVPLKVFGVTFTCDPEFSKHGMVAEVAFWSGDALVSWKNLPDRVTFSRRADLSGLSEGIVKKSSAKAVDWNLWRNVFRRVESVFGRPQDIEWGIAEDGSPFVFQSRPITTLDASDIALIREFDRYETENAPVWRELVRNELSEVFDEPTHEELDFLTALYRSDAVVSAYARYGISYDPNDFLVTVAGRLFIDPKLEKRCFEAAEFSNPLVRFWRKNRNFWRLGSVGSSLVYGKKDALDDLENRMFEALEAAVSALESKEKPELSEFLNLVYPPVFEANFLAASIAKYVKKNPVGFHSEYVPKNPEPWAALFARVAKAKPVGNSLSFRDVSKFSTPLADADRFSEPSSEGAAAWLALDFLREAGRAVSVICSTLYRPSSKVSVHSPARCPAEIRFPQVRVEPASALSWAELSEGSASGKFVTLANLEPDESDPVVVFVERLLPSLAETLPNNVVAVVSRTGGRLSHFAIVARERGLPTFVSPSVRPSEWEGKRVSVSNAWLETLPNVPVTEPVEQNG